MRATVTTQTQAPRCSVKSRGRCAVCRRATRADELLLFLFCPNCYKIILCEIEKTLARQGKAGGGGTGGGGNVEEATALGNPEAALRITNPRLGKAAGEYARSRG
jgi:hypothetical protein